MLLSEPVLQEVNLKNPEQGICRPMNDRKLLFGSQYHVNTHVNLRQYQTQIDIDKFHERNIVLNGGFGGSREPALPFSF